jgi:prophage DNA circulation protein
MEALIGEDTNKSVRAIAAEELTKQLVPSTAQESLNTLEEIAAWIQSHPGDAATMNAAIEKNADDIANLVSTVSGTANKVTSLETLLGTVDALAKQNKASIEGMNSTLTEITAEDTGILAQAKAHTVLAIEGLELGSAAKAEASDFDGAGSADAALAAAKEYVDNAFMWGTIEDINE